MDLIEGQVNHKAIQIITTTHSPDLLSLLNESSLEYASLIYRLSHKGHDLPNKWSWQAIRADVSLKETYFEPFVSLKDLQDSPGWGRKILGKAAARRYDRIR